MQESIPILKNVLASAAWRGRSEAVAVLRLRAHPSAINPNGYTALSAAAEKGEAEIAGLLLSRGVDPNLPRKSWESTLWQSMGDQRTVKLLLERGVTPTPKESSRD